MATPHIGCEKNDIAKTVIVSGDPLRAKYIAENFLKDYKLVNEVRGMYAYTGYYKDKRVTVMGHGMGIPSMGLYSYELYKFYEVENIIRIGSAGSFNEKIKINDIVLAKSSYSKTYFPKLLNDEDISLVESSNILNNSILNTAKKLDINLKYGKIITSDVFDVYTDSKKFESNFKNDLYYAVEMEAFALFYVAKMFNKNASCLLTIVDSKYEDKVVSKEVREKGLNDMIVLALESII